MLFSEQIRSVLALSFGLLATVALALAVSTDYWLFTCEPIQENYSVNNISFPIRMSIKLHSGLWRMCVYDWEILSLPEQLTQFSSDYVPPVDTPKQASPVKNVSQYTDDNPSYGLSYSSEYSSEAGNTDNIMNSWDSMESGDPYNSENSDQMMPESSFADDAAARSVKNCTNIAYSGQVYARVDGADTTLSITRAIRGSTPIVIVSLLLLPLAVALATIGNIKANHMTFIGALLYVASALCLASGVIVYVSALNDEVSYRKRPLPGVKDEFSYFYGWAFFCAGFAFIGVMLASVINVSLYISRRNDVIRSNYSERKHVKDEPRLITLDLPRSPRFGKKSCLDDGSHSLARCTYNLMHAI